MLSEKERAVRERLYFPDGTPKVYTRAKVVERERDKLRRLVEALLDKRNDDEVHSLLAFTLSHYQGLCCILLLLLCACNINDPINAYSRIVCMISKKLFIGNQSAKVSNGTIISISL